jgi:hypothetical protein
VASRKVFCRGYLVLLVGVFCWAISTFKTIGFKAEMGQPDMAIGTLKVEDAKTTPGIFSVICYVNSAGERFQLCATISMLL